MKLMVLQRPVSVWLLFSVFAWHCMSQVHAADHFVSAGTSSVDCRTFGGGIKPGDTITLAGGTRGSISIRNCVGTAENRIIIRNDATSDRPVLIRRSPASSGGFVFLIEDVEYIEVDGTAGWRGSVGHCGWAKGELGTNCGIQITRTSVGDTPTAFMKFQGLFRNYSVRGIRIDGRSWGTDDLGDGGAGIGIQQNSPETMADHRNYWRENILYEQNYVHNTRTECMYIGPNWKSSAPEIPLRNLIVQDTYMHDCGRNAITMKSALGGNNVIQRNYAERTGLQKVDTGLGGMFGFSSTHLRIYQNVVIDSAGQCFGINPSRVPSAYTGGYFYAENNIGVRCGSISHPELGYGISVRSESGNATIDDVTIDYNTIVESESHAIRVSNIDSSNIFVRNNIVASPGVDDPISAPGTVKNNRTDSINSLGFVNATANNYQLSEESPARNAGMSPFPPVDLRGVPRPQDRYPDQGAFEFSSQSEEHPKSPVLKVE